MKFEKHHEALTWFRQYKPYDGEYEDWYAENVKFGDWILFQHIRNDEHEKTISISRPILGIFVGLTVWDMACVLNIMEAPRPWTIFHEVCTNPNPENKYYMHICSLDPETESFPIWTDWVHEIAHWNHKPNVKELKQVLTTNKLG